MRVYQQTQSAIYPQEFEITDNNVFISKNIQEFAQVNEQGEEQKYYLFDLYMYTKDEYLELLKEDNKILNEQLLNTQLALCEIYELLGGEE